MGRFIRPYVTRVWPQIRRADIPPDLRKRFEWFGEDLMKVAIESGDATRIGPELARLGQDRREEIVLWLQERRDIAERRNSTMYWIGWVTVVVVVLGFLLDHVFVSHRP